MISSLLKFLLLLLLFVLFTVFTQIGGFILLACIPLFRWIQNKKLPWVLSFFSKAGLFMFLYLLVTLTIVKPIARKFGRIPLPLAEHAHVAPLSVLTCLLNRNYVTPRLFEALMSAADEFHQKDPGSTILYLDANFPFVNGFPLFPHLSHNDGQKIDLAFFYKDSVTNKYKEGSPSPIGYGVYERPTPREENTAAFCKDMGYWQYGLLEKLVPQNKQSLYTLDQDKTKRLIQSLVKQQEIEKLFIEPYLKSRMGLESEKIRFHGCGAVRHDDHIHLQVRS